MRIRSGLGLVVLTCCLGACGRVLDLPPAEHRDDPGEAARCATHTDCLTASSETDPAICVNARCTSLLTPECPLVLPQTDGLWLQALQADGPEPLVFGAFTDIRRGASDLNGYFAYDYDLAFTEVTRALGGVPVAGGNVRPVLGVVCANTFDTPDDLDRAVDHLSNDLHVPGILATLELDDLERAFDRTASAQVFYMNLRDADPGLVARAHDGLMWHLLPGWDGLLPSYQALIDRTLRHLKRTGALGADEPARVALVRAYDSPETNALGTALLEHLVVNGAPLEQNPPGFSGSVVLLDIPQAHGTQNYDYNPFLDELRQFEPHVVIFATYGDFSSLLQGLEARQPRPAPFYVLSPNQMYQSYGQLVHTIAPQVYVRLAGINFSAAADTTAYDAFQMRFDAAYPEMAGRLQHTENQYDGPWYLLYAAAAARGAWPLAGSNLGLGMRQLLSGKEYTVGPDDVPSAMAELKPTGASIELYGTMGAPNFDPATGTRPDPGTVWCFDADGTLHADVLRLDGTGELSGTFPCFDFDD